MAFLKLFFSPHSLIITVLTFLFIWVFQFLFFSKHFLDPFNTGLRDYEITDIVYSRFRSAYAVDPSTEIVLVNTGIPDREKLAALLDRIGSLEPGVVALDITLEGRKDPAADSLLKAAIDKIPRLVLACRLTSYDQESDLFDPPLVSDPYFSEGKRMGFTNFVSEDTSIIRLFSPREMTTGGSYNAFSVEMVRQYAPEKAGELFKRGRPVEKIWYTGNQQSFIKLEGDALLDDGSFQKFLEGEALKGKMVMVGYVGNHQAGEPELDRFFTPLNPRYTGKSYPDMYGLEIHANIATMVLRGQYVFQLPGWVQEFLGYLFCYFNVLLFHWIYLHVRSTFHGITRLIQLFELAAIFFLIALFFYYFRIQVNLSHGILAMLLSYDFIMVYEDLIRQKIKILQKI